MVRNRLGKITRRSVRVVVCSYHQHGRRLYDMVGLAETVGGRNRSPVQVPICCTGTRQCPGFLQRFQPIGDTFLGATRAKVVNLCSGIRCKECYCLPPLRQVSTGDTRLPWKHRTSEETDNTLTQGQACRRRLLTASARLCDCTKDVSQYAANTAWSLLE